MLNYPDLLVRFYLTLRLKFRIVYTIDFTSVTHISHPRYTDLEIEELTERMNMPCSDQIDIS